jgi:hypothetical protein
MCAALLALVLAGCAAPTPTPLPVTPGQLDPQGYPPPATQAVLPQGYPLATASVVPTLAPGEAPFIIDRPVVTGATSVTGSGTPGVPLLLQNVTFMGEVIAQGQVDSDGRFAFAVPPLEENVMLGIGLGDLAGTRWTPDYFLSPAFKGEGALPLPNVGYFLDTVLVTPP